MLGITPRLLSRPLGFRHTTRNLRTVVIPRKHGFLQHEALRTVRNAGYKSKVAGDNESGHIEAGENEGMFFIDSKYYKGSWPLVRVHKMLHVVDLGFSPLLMLDCQGSSLYNPS